MPDVQPTNNPVPSDNPADARDNFKRIDEVVNSTENLTSPTRTGVQLVTLHRYSELVQPNIDGARESAAEAAESAAAAEAAASGLNYQGLWPDAGGSANKGDTYQTQVGGTGTGQYFTALKNTTVTPFDDNENWRGIATKSTQDALVEDVAKNSEDITTLDTRTTDAEGDITTLDTRTTDAEGDITTLDTRTTDAEGDISALDTRTTDAEGDISALQSGQNSGTVGYATQADLYADLNHPDKTVAYVTNDSTATNNGTYRKSGDAGSGSWVQASSDIASQAYQRATDNEQALQDYDLPLIHKKTLRTLSENNQDFDRESVIEGYFVNWTSGELQANVSFNSSDNYIDIDPSTNYYLGSVAHYAVYDRDKVFISGQTLTSSGYTAVVSSVNAAFIRVSFLPSSQGGVIVAKGSAEVPFELYGSTVNPEHIQDIDGSNIVDGGLSPNAMSFLQKRKNLLNSSNLLVGYFMGSNGILVADPNFSVSNFIEVTPGANYKYSNQQETNARFWTAFDENRDVVTDSGSDLNWVDLTIPVSGVKYIKITVISTASNHQFEGGSLATPYEDFKFIHTDDVAVVGDSIDFVDKTKNLFDESSLEDAFSGSSGTVVPSGIYHLSDYIEVTPSTQYTYSSSLNPMRFWTAFDEDKNVVPSEGSDTGGSTFTTPASGVKYMRISVHQSNTSRQLEEGSTATAYEKFGYKYNDKFQGSSASSGYEGKFVSFGDSITAQESWQPKVASRLNLGSVVRGIGGAAVSGTSSDSFWQDDRINTLDTDADVLVIMGGTNDWAQDAALGAIDSTNTNEFNGAFNVMMQKIMTRFSDARDDDDPTPPVTKKPVRIIIASTPYGELPSYAGRGWVNAYTNNQGLTTNDYAEACRLQAKRWNIPMADVNLLCGWNTYNITKFIKQDGGFLHPNDTGGDRLAGAIIGVLESLPINNQ